MAVSTNTRRIYSIVALAIIGALAVWLFLRFILFTGVDSPINGLKSGDFIRLKNEATGKYLNLCSLNRQPGQLPVVVCTANGDADDPTTVFEVLVEPVKGASWGEKAVALRTVTGCDVRTCGLQNDPSLQEQRASSGLMNLSGLSDSSGILPIEPIVGPHVYLFMSGNESWLPSNTFPGNVTPVALDNTLTSALNPIIDETILNTLPQYPKTGQSQSLIGRGWWSMFWWPGVDRQGPGAVGLRPWTIPANTPTEFNMGLGVVEQSVHGACRGLIAQGVPRVLENQQVGSAAAWTIEKIATRLSPPL